MNPQDGVTTMVNGLMGTKTYGSGTSVNGTVYGTSVAQGQSMYQPTMMVAPHGTSVRKVSEIVTSEKLNLPTHAYEQSSRKISSVVVFEEAEMVPEKNVRYVEVPQYEEIIKHVIRKEIREVEKFVPKIVEEWVERIVEMPQIEEVVRHVEVPQIQEVLRHVPKIEIVDRPFDVIKEVAKIEINKVEKVVELGSEVIEVPTAILVEERMPVTHYEDKEAMLIVSHKVKPVIIDNAQAEVVVDIMEYEPEVMPVDIHVAKFVDQELVMIGAKDTIHRCVTVSAAQYNSILRYLNVHLSAEEVANLPYLADYLGQVSFLPNEFQWFAPQEGLQIYGYRSGVIWGEGSVINTATSKGMSENDIRVRQAELDNQFQQIFNQFENEKIRRMNALEDFNRRSEQNARALMGSQSTPYATYGINNYNSAIAYEPQPNNTVVYETITTQH